MNEFCENAEPLPHCNVKFQKLSSQHVDKQEAVLEETLELEKIDFSYNTRKIVSSMSGRKEEDTV